MLVIQEVWFDMNDDGTASRIRMSVKPQDASGYDLHKGATVEIELAGPQGSIGRALVRWVAFIKGLAILEVVQLLPEAARSLHPWPSVPAVSAPQLEGP